MTTATDLVLGLDGGGTGTRLAVADRDGALVHFSHHPSLDPFAHGDWRNRMERAVVAVGPLRSRLAGAVLGMPCHGEVARHSQEQIDAARALLPEPHAVMNDVEAAFHGALADKAGVLLLAGTGSMAWAGNAQQTIRCGGWGDVFGDEGSAFWIGREALGLASRALDGRSSHEAFAKALLREIGCEADGLLAWCYGLPEQRAAVAGLARFVDQRAEAGDEAAMALLTQSGDALAVHAEACARRLDLQRPLPWSYAGSVFRSRTVMARVSQRLEADPLPPRLPPIGGALLCAARRAGWAGDHLWIERLGRALSGRDRDAETT